ncbi:MAG: hypothetical protein GY782_08475 [Gammaproteobacteria bacterium]|nr:hypothetical protein [Gammaproteobacteria bacterium]
MTEKIRIKVKDTTLNSSTNKPGGNGVVSVQSLIQILSTMRSVVKAPDKIWIQALGRMKNNIKEEIRNGSSK